MTTISRAEVLEHVRKAMEDLFAIDPARVKLETNVVEDLDLDSIDAIELAVRMETLTGQRLDPESFKEMRTIADVVEILYRLLGEAPSAPKWKEPLSRSVCFCSWRALPRPSLATALRPPHGRPRSRTWMRSSRAARRCRGCRRGSRRRTSSRSSRCRSAPRAPCTTPASEGSSATPPLRRSRACS